MARPSFRHAAEYAALRVAIGLLQWLPIRTAGRFGAVVGRVGYSPLGIRRAVAESQITAAFPGIDPVDVRRIARGAYENLGRTTVEAAVLPAAGKAAVLALVEEVNWGVIEEAAAEGKGIILVGGHLGNWELAAAYIAARGVPLDAIVRGMANPLFDRYVNATRAALGMRVVHDADAVRTIPRALRDGHAVGFLADQGVQGLASTFVPFFGRLAKTPRGPAVFALRFGAPVVFVAMIRLPNGRYRYNFERIPVVPTGDRERDVDAIVAAFTSVLERWARATPEQYFWQHRRWKHRPTDEDKA